MSRSFWAIPIAAPLIILLAVSFGRAGNSASPLLGKAAPALSLRSLSGKTVTLASLRGRPVVLNFWATWCTDCALEQSYLVHAWRRFAPQGVAFVGVSFKDSSAAARSFLARHGGRWPDLQDPGQQAAIDFGVTGVPETFLIDRSGVVRYKSTGPVVPQAQVTPADMAADLQRLLARQA
ncbi:MAG: TlpA family protein disulfide reductase [Chloroflexota bacterium]